MSELPSTAPQNQTPGTVCENCGRKFPHLGHQPAPGVTKWFCNKSCLRKWEKGEAGKKATVKIELPKMGKIP